MPSLEQLLKKREGSRNDVYIDKLGKPIVGIGHLVKASDKLKVGDKISDPQISAFFKKDSLKALAAARKQVAIAKIDSKDFVVYLASVNFQLGTVWHKKFKTTWKNLMERDYKAAAEEVRKSRWFKQTPVRGKDFHRAILKLAGKADAEDDD